MHLLDADSCVVEVTFEADGPKSFDDVVVKYSPSVARGGPERISAEYHQVKWHGQYGGRFGYRDLIDPKFINATSHSILERLRQAKETVTGQSARFSLITMDRIKDDDPLASLVSGTDKCLLVKKLFDGTTDKSRMGKVRKLWREHLGLSSDDELQEVVVGLRIFEGHLSLEELRSQINLRAKVVGLISCSENSDFRYDELARQLKARRLNSLTKDVLIKLCEEEGLLATVQHKDAFDSYAIRSFLGTSGSVAGATDGNTLILTDDFQNRYLVEGTEWQRDIKPKVTLFLKEALKKTSQIRLILDAHASIAFLSGTVLNTKTGVKVDLVQKGRVGTYSWSVTDNKNSDVKFEFEEEDLGSGNEIAVAINVSQNVTPAVKKYMELNLLQVGTLASFNLPAGPSQQSVAGGAHAAMLAEQLSNLIRQLKNGSDAIVHIFSACPNSLLFFLGQQFQGISPCVIYEFDFDRERNKTYHPSFIMD